jgi:hypothetical protein
MEFDPLTYAPRKPVSYAYISSRSTNTIHLNIKLGANARVGYFFNYSFSTSVFELS